MSRDCLDYQSGPPTIMSEDALSLVHGQPSLLSNLDSSQTCPVFLLHNIERSTYHL